MPFLILWNPIRKVFVVRAILSESSYNPPDESDNWKLVDDTGIGFLDALAEVSRRAGEEGWKNYIIRIER